MTQPGKILLLHEVMDTVTPMIVPEFEVLKLWEYRDFDALLAEAGDAVRVIATHGGHPIGHELVEALPNLGLIASVGVGYDGVDVGHARANGVEVTYGAGVNADDVADVALGLILVGACDMMGGYRRLMAGEWTETYRGPQRRSMRQRHVGIFGLGMIGNAITRRLEPFGCRISWYGPNPKPNVSYPRAESLAALAREVDILVVAAPLDAATEKVVDREIIDALGPDGLLVNIARGGLVDEDAMIAALRDGRLGAAALDVQEEEPTPPARWHDVPNVFLTPHIGGFATGGLLNIGETLRQNLRRFFAGEPVLHPVPEVKSP